MVTLEELILDGLDADVIPPGTAVILRLREPLPPEQVTCIRAQVKAVAQELDIKIAVVSYGVDVYVVPQSTGAVNGTPEQEEIRR